MIRDRRRDQRAVRGKERYIKTQKALKVSFNHYSNQISSAHGLKMNSRPFINMCSFCVAESSCMRSIFIGYFIASCMAPFSFRTQIFVLLKLFLQNFMVMVLGGVVYDALARVFAHAESEEIQAIGEHIVHVLVNLLFSLLYKEGRGTQL